MNREEIAARIEESWNAWMDAIEGVPMDAPSS